MEGFAYFPSLVYREEKPELVHSLRTALIPHIDWARKNIVPTQERVPMLQTPILLGDANFTGLCEYLLEAALVILKDQGYSMEYYEPYVAGLWGQSLVAGGSTDLHVHKNSQLSGWIFLDRPAEGAYPVFKDPRYGKAMVELDFEQGSEIVPATNLVNFNNIRSGTVLIANSWLPHQLLGGQLDEPTLAIHFILSCRDKREPCCTL